MCKKLSLTSSNLFFYYFSTIINRLCSELNRLVREIALERDVLIDFQSKLDAAEYIFKKSSKFLFSKFLD